MDETKKVKQERGGKKNYPLVNLDEALKIAEQLGDLKGKATDLNNIGGIYFSKVGYENAIKYMEQSLEICKELKLPNEIKQIQINLEIIKKKNRNNSLFES